MKKFSLHEPKIEKEEIFSVNQCLKTGWLSPSGSFVKKFQDKLNKLSKTNLVLTNCGTSALHLSLILSNAKKGNEVMVPTISFIATVNAILYVGCHPIFFDCQKNNPNIDIDKVIFFLKNRTFKKNGYTYNINTKRKISALIITHVFGNVLEFSKLKKICKNLKIKIIEDAAEALGSQFKNKKQAGTLGDYGVLSFNINKIITSSGGGALFIKNKKQIKRAKLLIKQSKTNDILFHHSEAGYNYGMSNIAAAIGFSQLKRLGKILNLKKKIYKEYKKNFKSNKNIELINASTFSNNWLNGIIINDNSNYSKLKNIIAIIEKNGVQARPLWYPCDKQIYLRKYEKFNLFNSNRLYKKIICLPSSYFLNKKDIIKISKIVLNVSK